MISATLNGPAMCAPVAGSTLTTRYWSRPVTINIDGRQTYQDSQFRSWSLGNITADPATETASGSLLFGFTQLTAVLSDPTMGDRWFSGRTPNPAFPHPTTFLGDYSGIRDNPFTTGGFALWTDMRIDVCFGVRCGHGEDAFYASFF
jgi:hypothetical protein